MSSIRDSLRYHHSPYTVTDHAAEADAILEACAREFPQLLRYLLEPSNLLALGGFRGVSPYADFGKHNKLVAGPEFTAFLHRFGLRLILEKPSYGVAHAEPSYLLIHTGAFEALKQQYRAVAAWWDARPREYDYLNYVEWYTYHMLECEMRMEKDELPAQWLANWWAPHHICFGMLLGYPGAAISSLAASDMVYKTLGVQPDMMTVEFTYPEDQGAPVSYEIQASDAGSKQIRTHAERWQTFFDMLYQTWPASRLPDDK